MYAPEFGTNELGFYGLGGNAAEWCQEQVLCGGSWFDGESEDLDHLETDWSLNLLLPMSGMTAMGFGSSFKITHRSKPVKLKAHEISIATHSYSCNEPGFRSLGQRHRFGAWFGNGMVLQRSTDTLLQGYGPPGKTLAISLRSGSRSLWHRSRWKISVDGFGHWKLFMNLEFVRVSKPQQTLDAPN